MVERRRILFRIILIILGAVVMYLAGNARVSLWDRDEPRYAQTSRQMLQSGDWVVPRFLDQVRTAKPVFIYWCQAASMMLLGDNPFAARLPSVIAMTLTLIFLSIFLWKTLGPQVAMWSVFILATAGLSAGSAKLCLTDAVLLVPITIAQICLLALYLNSPLPSGEGQGEGVLEYESVLKIESPLTPALSRRERGWVALVMWIAIGIGVLIKGPVILGVQLTTMLVLAIMDWKKTGIRWWLRIKPHVGIPIVIAIGLPWAYLIHQREPQFFATILGHDVINRIRTPLEGHKGPPGYYLLTIWITYFPWSVLLPAATIFAWKNRSIPHIRFALAAVIGPWIMFELVQTKLPHYLLPVFPALAFLTAGMLERNIRLQKLGAVLGITMMVAVTGVYGFVLPHIEQLRTSINVAEILRKDGAAGVGNIIMIDYKEPSLAFYEGGSIREQRNDRFLEVTPPEDWPKWITLTASIWERTPDPIKGRLEVLGMVEGWNYAGGGRMVKVMVMRKRESIGN